MNKETLQEYIKGRGLHFLWVFGGTTYYEDQMGNAISLQEIERHFSKLILEAKAKKELEELKRGN